MKGKFIFRLLLFLVIGALPLWGAIFASDAIYVYYDGKPIDDNRILVVTPDNKINLCAKGSFWLRQGPDWLAGPYTFYMAPKRLLTFAEWKVKQHNNTAVSLEAYQAYLWQEQLLASDSLTITLPTLDADPPLDMRPHPAPPKGMVGGKLGFDRFYKLDLKHQTLDQFKR